MEQNAQQVCRLWIWWMTCFQILLIFLISSQSSPVLYTTLCKTITMIQQPSDIITTAKWFPTQPPVLPAPKTSQLPGKHYQDGSLMTWLGSCGLTMEGGQKGKGHEFCWQRKLIISNLPPQHDIDWPQIPPCLGSVGVHQRPAAVGRHWEGVGVWMVNFSGFQDSQWLQT